MAKKGRRANGEGSIFYLEKKKLWCAEVSLGTTLEGKSKRKKLYAKTKAEVIQKKKELEASLTTGTYTEPSTMTFKQYLTSWLEDVYKPTVRPSTFTRNKITINKHIIPTLGSIKLVNLTPLHLQNLYTKLTEEGQAPRSIRNLHFVLHKALDQAVKWSYITRNISDLVDLPKPRKEEVNVLTATQVDQFLKVAEGCWYYALYVTALTTGLRQGELLGLSWDDVDLDKGSITVRRTLNELSGHLSFGEPKTRSGRRTVTLPLFTVKVLREHRKSQLKDGLAGSGLVFTDTQGGAVRSQNMTRRSFKPLLKKAGLPEIRFHDLRHTHATLLLQQEVNPKLVQERLGHSSINITLDTYSHVLPNMQKQVAQRLDVLFGA